MLYVREIFNLNYNKHNKHKTINHNLKENSENMRKFTHYKNSENIKHNCSENSRWYNEA